MLFCKPLTRQVPTWLFLLVKCPVCLPGTLQQLLLLFSGLDQCCSWLSNAAQLSHGLVMSVAVVTGVVGLTAPSP